MEIEPRARERPEEEGEPGFAEEAPSAPPEAARVRPPPGIATPATGFAACPACAARNPFDARRCGRCAAEIPPPGAAAGSRPAVSPGAAIAVRVGAAEGLDPGADPLEVLPPAVREQVLAARAKRDAHSAASLLREERRTRAVAGGSAGAAVVAGWVVSLVLIDGWLWLLFAAGVDAAAGGAAGWFTWTRGGGTLRGLLAYGAAAFVSAGVKLLIGGIPVGFQAAAAFLVLLPVTWGAAVLGALLGQRIDDWLWDQS